MHASAYKTARQFFQTYGGAFVGGTVLDIGSCRAVDTQRTMRNLCPAHMRYIGVDLGAGANVDVVMDDPYTLPFAASSVDIVLCSSVFEHAEFFWLLFAEVQRVLKPEGLFYLNAPANGYFHRFPVDCWRFYPDSGFALARWAQRQGYPTGVLETFVSDADTSEDPGEIWNDLVAVFIRDAALADRYAQRMIHARDDYSNGQLVQDKLLLKAHVYPGRLREDSLQAGRKEKAKFRLYQIAYSEETKRSVPEGFLALDNLANERPDWAEYWPIRRFLLTEPLDEDTLYGFFSPRFAEKTLMSADDARAFVASLPADVDVATLSPYWDHGALFLNVFEHGDFVHPGFMRTAQEFADAAGIDVDLKEIINTLHTAIYCNFFAAKPRFWREWLRIGEVAFAIAEDATHPLADRLNRPFSHRGSGAAAKVFLIERIASLLLAATPGFKVGNAPRSSLTEEFNHIPYPLVQSLNALKEAAVAGQRGLLEPYRTIQSRLLAEDKVAGIHVKAIADNAKFGGDVSGEVRAPTAGTGVSATDAPGIGWLLRRIFK